LEKLPSDYQTSSENEFAIKGLNDDELFQRFGRFPEVLSMEVVEHVYAPRDYGQTFFDLDEPVGQKSFQRPTMAIWKTW
jgi:hypothetical protein